MGIVNTINNHINLATTSLSNTVPTANLGSGSASSSTFLRGDQTWAAVPTQGLINVQYLTASSGTYTKTAGTVSILVEAVAGGGGGGGCPSTSGTSAAGAGGGGGAYARKYFSSAPSGVSYAVGAGGAGGVGGSVGSNGGDTTFDVNNIHVTGGIGGNAGVAVSTYASEIGGIGGGQGSSDASDMWVPGGQGGTALVIVAGSVNWPGMGGASGGFASGGAPNNNSLTGNTATGYGGGGSGALATSAGAARNGGAGASGLIIVYEYS